MKFLVLLPLLCLVASGAERVAKKDVGSKQRSADLLLPGIGEVDIKDLTKLFSLPNISVPTLPPLFPEGAPCVSMLSARAGTCKKREECESSHGLSDGSCALSLGVCCTKAFTCGSLIFGNVSVISNPGYPSPSKGSDGCDFIISKMAAVTQIRLDFEDFDISGVDEEGKCSQDVFEVEGANPGFKIPRICGMNRGQHLYIPVDKTLLLSQVKLRFISSSGAADRLFKIRVTQLGQDHPIRAPAGCLQYFTGRSGSVSSFNFEHNKNVGIKTIKGLNYGVCFRKEDGFCSLKVEPVFTRSRRSIPYRYPIQPSQHHSRRFVAYPSAQMNHYGPPAVQPYYGMKHDNFYPSKPENFFPSKSENYYPSKPETKIEAKVELVKDLIAEKMKLIEQVLSGMNLPGLQVPTVTALIEAELKKLLPVKEAFEKVIETKIEAKLEKPQYNNYNPKEKVLETKFDVKFEKPLLPNLFEKFENKLEAKFEKPQPYNYNHNKYNNYYPSKPDLKETKVEIVKDLIEEKTKLIEELLSGRKDKVLFPGLAVPVIPLLPSLPTVQTITDDLKKLLPGVGSVDQTIATAIVSPDFVDNGSVCNDRDSIGIPPQAVLCEENARPTIISTSPFAVFVDTRGSVSSRGFHFIYTQQICQ